MRPTNSARISSGAHQRPFPTRSPSAPLPPLAGAIAGLLFLLSSLAAPAAGQCSPQWLSGSGVPGTNGTVLASTLWDPDGAGPLPPVLVIAGAFTSVGTISARNIAAWNPVTRDWSALGSGLDNACNALTATSSGELIAGGDFVNAGGSPASRIARWSPSSNAWSALGGGLNGSVASVAALPGGDIVAGGSFTSAGGVPVNRVARWSASSSTWSAMSTGFNSPVLALAVLTSGDLVAGGNFFVSGGNCIARWDGSGWISIVGGCSGTVRAICPIAGGGFIAGGDFGTVGSPTTSASRIARFDGTSWSSLGLGLNAAVRGIATLADGRVIAVGDFTGSGPFIPCTYAAQFTGGAWSAMGGGASSPINTATSLPSGSSVALGGTFARVNEGSALSLPCPFVASWTPSSSDNGGWAQLSTGFNSQVNAILPLSDGTYYVAGAFTTAGGQPTRRIAFFNGTTFVPLGSGLDSTVLALARTPNGDIYAGGDFLTAGGSSAPGLARWNGSSWSSVGGGLVNSNGPVTVTALTLTPSGDLIIAGNVTSAGGTPITTVARWNGTAWSAVGSNLFGTVFALTSLGGGQLLAGGDITSPSSKLALFDGSTWIAAGSGADNTVRTLVRRADGTIIAGGFFTSINGTPANRIAVGTAGGNAVSWAPLAGGVTQTPVAAVLSAVSLPNGDIIAGGGFNSAGGTPASNIARYNWAQGTWSGLVSGLNGSVAAVASLPNGDVLAGGGFSAAGGVVSNFIARFSSPDPVSIIAGPTPASACVGTPTSLTVLASGSTPLSYQWRKNGQPIGTQATPSAATPTLTFPSVLIGDEGSYDCVVSNACSTESSLAAAISVTSPVAIAAQPQPDARCANESATFGVQATGSEPISYQWFRNGQAVGGGVGPSLSTDVPGEYTVSVSNSCGTVLSEPATLVEGSPFISVQPVGAAINIGETITLSVTVRGRPDMNYQWYFNGGEIANGPEGVGPGGGSVTGASGTVNTPASTTLSFTLTGFQSTDAGEYTIFLTTACGALTSDVALVTVPTSTSCSLADIDPVGGDGIVDGNDFVAFINSFAIGDVSIDPIADVAGGGPEGLSPDGTIDGTDFVAFINAFALGC